MTGRLARAIVETKLSKGQLSMPVFVLVLVVLAVVLYLLGGVISSQSIDGVISNQSIEIAGCRAEWSTTARQVTSELCPNATEPCIAQPLAQQRNAIVEVLLCACGKASDGGAYPNSQLNRQIEGTFKEAFDTELPVREICEGGGGVFMVRWRYG